jgi:uncharacterized protein
MPQLTDSYDLGRLQLSSGEGRRLDLDVALEPFDLTGVRYPVEPAVVPVVIDISRTTGPGYALRLRFAGTLTGACMRCLGAASPTFEVDVREVHIHDAGEELTSPYIEGDSDELDVARWARDALALEIPAQIVCSPECRGLCARCGANLNDDPGHAHEPEPDPRWAKLSEIKFD